MIMQESLSVQEFFSRKNIDVMKFDFQNSIFPHLTALNVYLIKINPYQL